MKRVIQTRSGRLVDPLDLRVEDVDLGDIADALANICRFTGHSSRFYSVAEHSIHVAAIVGWLGGTEREQRVALLHDASEAYLMDVPSPLKHTPQFSFYREVEAEAQTVILDHFILLSAATAGHWTIDRADEIMLGIEARDLMGARTRPEHWSSLLAIPPPEAGLALTEWDLRWAPDWDPREEFLRLWDELGGND